MTKQATRPTTAPPAPPPTWQGRPGTIRSLPVLHASSAYAAAIALGLDLPPQLTAAVATASRANTIGLGVAAQVRNAQDEFLEGVRQYIRGDADSLPSLDSMGIAHAVDQVTGDALRALSGEQDRVESMAVAALRAAAPDLITQGQARLSALLDELAPAVAVIPESVTTIEQAARAPREVLDAWRDAADALPAYSALRELRDRLAQLAGVSDQARNDGITAFKSGNFTTSKYLANVEDPTAALVAVIRHRDELAPWLPSAEELQAALEDRAQKARDLRGSGFRVFG